MTVDLHLHSNLSDGVFSPEEMLDKAKGAGLEIISLTDHDSCSGYERLIKLSNNDGIKLICGVELSAAFEDKEIHILGYFKNGITEEFGEFVKKAQVDRDKRISEGLANLKEKGIDLSYEELTENWEGDSIGRNHLATLMVKHGHVGSLLEAFQNYLKYDLNIVPRTQTLVKQAIDMIKSSGGISIWAHPPFKLFDKCITTFMEMGLDGVEAYNKKKSNNNSFYYHTVAEKFGLLITAGSDWHGFPAEHFLEKDTYPENTLDKFINKIYG